MDVPLHVAIILDGNGRWAKAKGMPRNFGHIKGSKNVELICEQAWHLGVKYLTVYAFSTENWKRPKSEVDGLFQLLRHYLKNLFNKVMQNDMRIRVIGGRASLDTDLRETIEEVEEATKDNQGLNFTIALNYGGRDELTRAVKKIAEDVAEGKVRPDDTDEALFERYLDTYGIPDPDLLIRTGGEQRLSNFLLWQMAYTELYFTDVLWPDFTKEEFIKAIEKYNERDRRFGGVKGKGNV